MQKGLGYVRSNKMFQSMLLSLQHHGREDILEEPACDVCGKILSKMEKEDLQDICYACNNDLEDTTPTPKQVYGKGRLA